LRKKGGKKRAVPDPSPAEGARNSKKGVGGTGHRTDVEILTKRKKKEK